MDLVFWVDIYPPSSFPYQQLNIFIYIPQKTKTIQERSKSPTPSKEKRIVAEEEGKIGRRRETG